MRVPPIRGSVLRSLVPSPRICSEFFHSLVAKGRDLGRPPDAGRSVGPDRRPPGYEGIAEWLATFPKLSQNNDLAGLTRGLRLWSQQPSGTRRGAVLTRLLSSGSESVQRAAWEASRYFELSRWSSGRGRMRCPRNFRDQRVPAIRALRAGNYDSVASALEKLLQSHPPRKSRQRAVEPWQPSTNPPPAKASSITGGSTVLRAATHAVSAHVGAGATISDAARGRRNGLGGALCPGCFRAIPSVRQLRSGNPTRLGSCSRAPIPIARKVVASYQDAANLKGDVPRQEAV